MSFYQPLKTYIPRKRSRSRSRSRSRRRKKSTMKKLSEFRIKPFKKTTTASRFKRLDGRLPRPRQGGFRLLVVGSSGSGKTVLVLTLLAEYLKFFDSINVVTPAPYQYRKNLQLRKQDRILRFDEKEIVKIYEKHKARNRRKKKLHYTVFVLDDILFYLNESKAIKNMILNGRKHGVSFVITSQDFSATAPMIKKQISDMVFLSATESDLKNAASYFGLVPGKLVRAYRRYVSPVPFLFLYLKTNPSRVFLKFSKKRLLRSSSRSRRRKSRK